MMDSSKTAVKIKSIVVDDEINSRENLRGLLSRFCPEVEIAGEADSAIDAINLIQRQKPALVFLDVEMPGGNGFEILEQFKSHDFRVIFVTAYDHFVIQAIRFSALDYILKPINIMELKNAVMRYAAHENDWENKAEVFLSNRSQSPENKKVALSFGNKIEFVQIRDIIKCTGEGRYTKITIYDKEEEVSSKPLAEYEDLLSGCNFLRTHKAHIVNKLHIETYVKSEGGYLVMSDGSHVPISRRRKNEILSQIS